MIFKKAKESKKEVVYKKVMILGLHLEKITKEFFKKAKIKCRRA